MTMPTLEIAPGGPTFSRISAGFWRLVEWKLSEAELLAFVEGCLELGITTLDHADIYGDYRCEELFGSVLRARPHWRDRMQLVTKCGIRLISSRRPDNKVKHYDTGKKHILASVNNSLTALGTDRIDVLLIHRPDPFMDPDDTAAAFTELKDAGKVLHFGVSNFTPGQFELLASRLPFPLVTNQVEFSVLNMMVLADGTVDQCLRLRTAPMAWSPFGGGRLFGEKSEQADRVRNVLTAVGEKLGGAALDQVALAWVLLHPARFVPILGTGKLERVRLAAQAVELPLTREQWFAVWEASQGREVP